MPIDRMKTKHHMFNSFNVFFMKKIFFFSAALAALTMASCNKPSELAKPGEGRPVEVTVSINGANDTKAVNTSYADESKVNSLQVFVFNGDNLENVPKFESGVLQTIVPATAGERTVWALVNAPDMTSITSLSGLKAAVSNLSDNARDNFVMTGSTTQELIDGGTVAIDVRRIVSRVSINKISTDFKAYRADYELKVKSIYIINVAAGLTYDIVGEASEYVNKLGHYDDSYDALLYDAVDVPNVKNGSPYVEEHAFYPYPNGNAAGNFADDWSPRRSMLVIEAELFDGNGVPVAINQAGQTTGYYPIELPALERNKTYILDEVCISRLPGDLPYKPIETGETSISITVHDWELGLNLGTINI